MHNEILTAEQVDLLPAVHLFWKDFGLVGGTAIALQIGHRESIDFDLFTSKDFRNKTILKSIERKRYRIQKIFTDEAGQYTIVIDGVQMTFFQYDYPIGYTQNFNKIIAMPDLVTLGAMKAFELGRRAKWKDYVDLYFLLRDHVTIAQIDRKGREIFSNEYNARIFHTQLAYFEDIDYREEVVYKPGFAVDQKVIQKALLEHSLKVERLP